MEDYKASLKRKGSVDRVHIWNRGNELFFFFWPLVFAKLRKKC